MAPFDTLRVPSRVCDVIGAPSCCTLCAKPQAAQFVISAVPEVVSSNHLHGKYRQAVDVGAPGPEYNSKFPLVVRR